MFTVGKFAITWGLDFTSTKRYRFAIERPGLTIRTSLAGFPGEYGTTTTGDRLCMIVVTRRTRTSSTMRMESPAVHLFRI